MYPREKEVWYGKVKCWQNIEDEMPRMSELHDCTCSRKWWIWWTMFRVQSSGFLQTKIGKRKTNSNSQTIT